MFGEKGSDGRDTSLRLPPGVAGTLVEGRVFNRHGIGKDERALAIEREVIDRLTKDREDERAILNRATYTRLREVLRGQTAAAAPKGVKKGGVIDGELLDSVEKREWWKFAVADNKVQSDLEAMHGAWEEDRKSTRLNSSH